MSIENMLSGEELVKKGVTRLEANLPELGLKDVVPNGSWLEQKQIQASLEAKKHLLEVERIEKRGSLSQANWQEDLNLAKVTQKVGGYWQFLGHNVGRILYLKPEEALFLMEINCLELNYGGVKVSLQQAYSLLLRGDIDLFKYKVYASLSRIGYKVFRHRKNIKIENDNQTSYQLERSNDISDILDNKNAEKCMSEKYSTENANDSNHLYLKTDDNIKSSEIQETMHSAVAETSAIDNNNLHSKLEENKAHNNIQTYNNVYKSYQNKLLKLRNRKSKPSSNNETNDPFSNLPNLLEKRLVTIKVPESRLVPDNIQLKETYTINLQNLPKKCSRTCSRTYSSSDEANGSHVKRLRTESNIECNLNSNQAPNTRTSGDCRPIFFTRPQNLNYISFNMFFQRLHQVYFPSPFQHFGPQIYQRSIYNSFNCINGNRFSAQPNSRSQEIYLQRIKDLAFRLKVLLTRGNSNTHNVHALQGLINTYNSRYKTNLRLGPCFEIVNSENVVETIELDLDDEEPQSKRPKKDESFEDNLNSLKEMALELKSLEVNGKTTARHRRTFSKLVKTLNKCYNVDYYLSPSYEIVNKRHIILDSSSDTDCKVEEESNKQTLRHKRGKKLRNPFNILKRLSEKQDVPRCSNEENLDSETVNERYSDILRENVTEKWLPKENDFGAIEIPKEDVVDPLFDMKKTRLLYDFIKFKPNIFNNWLESKIAFVESLKETIAEFHEEISTFHSNYDKDCLVTPEDCANMESVLRKLRIIKTNSNVSVESRMNVDFDVYNRDVENFSKRNPPKTHFRVICLDESLKFPSASEIEDLRSQYDDDVPIVFALVSISSVSFLQVKPIETPLYTCTNTF